MPLDDITRIAYSENASYSLDALLRVRVAVYVLENCGYADEKTLDAADATLCAFFQGEEAAHAMTTTVTQDVDLSTLDLMHGARVMPLCDD